MMTENSSESVQTSTPSESASSAPSVNPGTEVSNSPVANPAATPSAASASGTVPGAPVAPQPFTPNFKFKAYGKEYEFDEWAKGFVKDADTEEKLRKLYAKAYGLDPLKEKFDKREQEFSTKEKHFQNLDRLAGEISYYHGSKDYDNLFGKQGLNIPFDELADWVGRKIDAMKNPAIAAETERQAQIRYQNFVLSQENQNWQKQFEQASTQAMSLQFETTLARPEVSAFAQAFDSKMGKIGAFRDSVAQIGEYEHLRSQGQTVISPEEAITRAMKQFGPFVGIPNASQGQNGQPPAPMDAANAQQTPQVQNPQQPGQAPIIPHVSGRGSSPVKKGFKNLDELKKYAKTL